MGWQVLFCDEFVEEFSVLSLRVREELVSHLRPLSLFGPALGRPRVDTLNGSCFPNMKELRFQADDGVWRVAFAFDPARNAVVLVAGDKAGQKERRFYKSLIARADHRFKRHLALVSES